MVSEQLIGKILSYLNEMPQPYVLMEKATKHGRQYIEDRYLPAFLAVDEPCRERVIDELHLSWQVIGNDHQEIDSWKMALKGVFVMLLFTNKTEVPGLKVFEQPKIQRFDPDQTGLDVVADIVVRLSRWFNANGEPFLRMKPYAELLVRRVWGNLEDMSRMKKICRPKDKGRVRFAPLYSSTYKPAALFKDDMTKVATLEKNGTAYHGTELIYSFTKEKQEWPAGTGKSRVRPADFPRLWYYTNNDKEAFGPFTFQQLNGSIQPHDKVWRVGWPAWLTVEDLSKSVAEFDTAWQNDDTKWPDE